MTQEMQNLFDQIKTFIDNTTGKLGGADIATLKGFQTQCQDFLTKLADAKTEYENCRGQTAAAKTPARPPATPARGLGAAAAAGTGAAAGVVTSNILKAVNDYLVKYDDFDDAIQRILTKEFNVKSVDYTQMMYGLVFDNSQLRVAMQKYVNMNFGRIGLDSVQGRKMFMVPGFENKVYINTFPLSSYFKVFSQSNSKIVKTVEDIIVQGFPALLKFQFNDVNSKFEGMTEVQKNSVKKQYENITQTTTSNVLQNLNFEKMQRKITENPEAKETLAHLVIGLIMINDLVENPIYKKSPLPVVVQSIQEHIYKLFKYYRPNFTYLQITIPENIENIKYDCENRDKHASTENYMVTFWSTLKENLVLRSNNNGEFVFNHEQLAKAKINSITNVCFQK